MIPLVIFIRSLYVCCKMYIDKLVRLIVKVRPFIIHGTFAFVSKFVSISCSWTSVRRYPSLNLCCHSTQLDGANGCKWYHSYIQSDIFLQEPNVHGQQVAENCVQPHRSSSWQRNWYKYFGSHWLWSPWNWTTSNHTDKRDPWVLCKPALLQARQSKLSLDNLHLGLFLTQLLFQVLRYLSSIKQQWWHHGHRWIVLTSTTTPSTTIFTVEKLGRQSSRKMSRQWFSQEANPLEW